MLILITGLDTKNNVDKNVKNELVWNWVLEKDDNGEILSDYLRKNSQPRIGICLWFKEILHYSLSGKTRIKLSCMFLSCHVRVSE